MLRLDDLNLTPGRTQRIVLLLLLTFFLLVSILSSADITITLDEPLHYHYGLRLLGGNSTRIDDSSMPVSALNALPGYIAGLLPDSNLRSILERYFIARLVTILFSAVVAAVVFRWARSVYGFAAAVLSTILYVFDPNIIAHSQLVTTDVFAAGMITVSFYLLWKFANSRRLADGLVCACMLGLSQLVKYTAIALFPLGLLALVAHDLPSVRAAYGADGVRAIGRYLGRLTAYAAVSLLVSILIINAGFLFNHTFAPLKDYRFRSGLFHSIQARLPVLANMPVPVPFPYLDGLDWVQYTDQSGTRFGNVYLLGRVTKIHGFPGYYFVASALKTPIATLVFVLVALVLYVAMPGYRASFLRREVFFLLPFIAFTLYFNYFFSAQTGIRYYLVVFPLMCVFAGHMFRDWRAVPAWAKATSAVLVIYLALSVLSYFPHFIPYFNELVWDKTQTYKYLSDSNLEWGQSQRDLQRFLAAHPEAVYDPLTVQSGLLVVSGSDLVGVLAPPERYAWLRGNFRPVETVAYAYFVYRISPEDVARLCASTSYCK